VEHNFQLSPYSFCHSAVNDKELVMKLIKQMDMREVYMQFLLHIDEDFDDDLLQDTIKQLIEFE
jgi:hypothetical protein